MPLSSRRQRPVAVLLGGALAVLPACTGPDAAPPPAPSGTAALQGRLGDAVDAMVQGSYRGSYANVRAVLVSVGPRVVLERYYGSSAEESHDVYSVTKSVMSLLVGVALGEGDLRSLDQTLAELLPQHAATMSPRLRPVTLQQVLTMTSGLPSDGDGSWFTGTPDWVGTILAAEPEHEPGTVFAYSNAASHLLSAVLVQATGRSVLDYAREKLFTPVGIDTEPAYEPPFSAEPPPAYQAARFAWPVDPQGLHLGFAHLKLTARDMLTIGQVARDHGLWNDTEIVPGEWVEESTRAHVPVEAAFPEAYGLHWWVVPHTRRDAFQAAGLGGQHIEVVRELDLVVAIASAVPPEGPAPNQAGLFSFVETVVIPAL